MMPQCPKATTVALKQESAFARQTVATIELNRWAWLVLANTWLLLAKTQEMAENGIKAGRRELTH